MANSLNRVTIIGNVGKDPEVRSTQSGGKILNLTVACSERWKDRASGEQKERTEWIRCVIFNPNLADIAERFVKKGSRIMIEGSMQTRKWSDQSGQEKYSTEVVLSQFNGTLLLLDSKRDGDAPSQPASRPAVQYREPASDGPIVDVDIGDSIPF